MSEEKSQMKENTFWSSACAPHPRVFVSAKGPPLRSEGGVVVFGRICHEVYIKREILMPVKGRGTL